MRVYEIAKELGVTVQDVIGALEKNGAPTRSHMSNVSDEELEVLRKSFTNQQQADKGRSRRKGSKSDTQAGSKRTTERPTATEHIDLRSAVKAGSSVVAGPMTVGDLATALGCGTSALIVTLLQRGIVAAVNEVLTEEQVVGIAQEYGAEIIKRSQEHEQRIEDVGIADGERVERAPVVVVLGHVDHGKTTLLDFIRSARVAARESGGITQHIGAYEVLLPWMDNERLVFLDTPGHQAFSAMRKRGIKVADLAILVVAADDGVMPQTVEALEHAIAMEIPIVVAINKVDKVGPERVEVVKQQLSQRGILFEDWGGDVVCVPISAKEGTGVNSLLEMLVLQSKMLDLRAVVDGSSQGFILEAEMEKGRGPVATVLLQHGHLAVGNHFVSGSTHGSVSSLVDSYGNRVNQVGVSCPVRVAGFSALPSPGDTFRVVTKEVYKKIRSSSDDLKDPARIGHVGRRDQANITMIVKADTNSSREALVDAMTAVAGSAEVGLAFVSTGVGAISESDVELASSAKADIIGFRVKPIAGAKSLARRLGVKMHLHEVIYKLLEDFEALAHKRAEALGSGDEKRKKIGTAEVLKVFNIKGTGVIAGCAVKEGRFSSEGIAVIRRDNQEIGRGKISSLQRERKAVKEVHEGFECGFLVEGFTTFKVGDTVECLL